MQELFIIEDLFNVLVELETLAGKHYTEMATLTNDKKLIDLFKRLAENELLHKELFLDYKSKAITFETNKTSPEYTEYMDALLKNSIVFVQRKEKCANFEEGFNLAVQLEKDTIYFLTEMKTIISKEFHSNIDNIIDQEREHIRYLFEYKK